MASIGVLTGLSTVHIGGRSSSRSTQFDSGLQEFDPILVPVGRHDL